MKNYIDEKGFWSVNSADQELYVNQRMHFSGGFTTSDNFDPKKIYISLSGSDSNGDGSYMNPYRTISKGVSVANAASDRSLTSPYVIEIGAGTFTETNFPVFVSQSIMIKGQGGNMTRVTTTGSNLTFFQMDYRTFLTDLTLNGGGGFNNKGIEIDIYNATTASVNINFVVPRILDCSFNGFNQGATITGVSGGAVIRNTGFNDCREGVTFVNESAYSEINGCNFDFFAITGSAILLKEGNHDTYFGEAPDVFVRNTVFRFCQSGIRSTSTDQTKGIPIAAAYNIFISCAVVLDLNDGSLAYFNNNRSYNTSIYELYQGFESAKTLALSNTVDLSKISFQPAGAANIRAVNYSLTDGDSVRYVGEHPETWYRTIASTIANGAQWRVRVESPGLFSIDNNTDPTGQFLSYERPFYINNSGSLNLRPYIGSIAASLSGNLILLNGSEARFLQSGNSSANYFGIKAPVAFNSSLTYTLPSTIPLTSSYLQTDVSGNLTWASGIGGEVNTVSNLGTGFGLFTQKVGSDLQFKSLVAGAGVSFTSNSQAITMSISSTGEANTASNLGTGFGLFAQKVGVDLQFKNLVAGSGIQLTSSSTGITITTTGSGGDVTSGTNLGTGEGIYDSKLLGSLQFKSLIAPSSSVGNVLSVSASATEISISRNPTSRTIHISEDWIANTYQGNYFWAQTLSGAGTNTTVILTDVKRKAIGEVQLTTGTTAVGRICLAQSLIGWRLDNLENSIQEWRVYIPALSTATQEYALSIGWLNTASALAQTAGLYFTYNRLVNGNNWQAVSTATTSTTVDTGVAVGTTNFVKLRIETNNALSQASYYIDDVLVATISTTLPVGAGRVVGPGAIIVKSVGTAPSRLNIDYMELVANISGR